MRPSSREMSGHHTQGISTPWDPVDMYFECITTCSLDDGECITRCVQQLRESED